MKSLILLAALCTPFWIFAQKHDYVWMHGNYNNFYIDFNAVTPNIYTVNSNYEFSRTLVFISDSLGNPSFYSNGCNILDSGHTVLANGLEILQNDYFCDNYDYQNFMHGLLVLPMHMPNKYLMISKSQGNPLPSQPCQTNRVLAHLIDMSPSQVIGLVAEKEQLLLSGCFQEPTANKHANGRDWWILLPDNQEERFYRWLLTPSGLEGPWTQELSNETIDGYWYCGWSEFSPNGEKYLINGCRKGVAVYDFNRCTGLLTNPRFINRSTIWNFGAVFSPNSQYLYTLDSSSTVLFQYNINSFDLPSTKTKIGQWDGTVDSSLIPASFGFMQHGPDGKLYLWGGGSSIMHTIDFPNRKGFECGFRQYAIQLPGTCFSANLYYPHYRLGPIDGSSCDT
ncbi:MAG TPA: hypothetical protein DCF33_06860, partial [Saprospirales bacterium]|nr:hypothetical protein [Saprospirales bacterium]